MNVDNPEVPTVEWFFGYGGNHLGLRRVIPGLRLVAVCEIEAFVNANMVSKMEAGLLDPAPCWTDCKAFPAEPFKDRIALFIASYPCQGFSLAGKRLGQDDPRHLWPYVRRFEQAARPLWVFFENVRGHVSLGLSTVLSDLAEDGYECRWGIFSAGECGAPHNRERVFILGKLADSEHREPQNGWSRSDAKNVHEGYEDHRPAVAELRTCRHNVADGDSTGPARLGEISGQNRSDATTGVRTRPSECSGNVPDTINEGLEGRPCKRENHVRQCPAAQRICSKWPSRPGEEQYPWEPPRLVTGKERFRLKHDGQFQYTADGHRMAYPHRVRKSQPEGMLGDERGRTFDEREGMEHPDNGNGPGEEQQTAGLEQRSETMERSDRCSSCRAPSCEPGYCKLGDTTNELGKRSGRPGHTDDGERSLDDSEIRNLRKHIDDKRSGEGNVNESTGPIEPRSEANGEIESAVGLYTDEYSCDVDGAINEDLSDKARAREVLWSMRKAITSETIQRNSGEYALILAETVLQSGVCLDSFPQRICFFVWCVQAGNPIEGFGLRGLWCNGKSWFTSQGQKPIEQCTRELDYAMCQLSYEIALERGQDPLEEKWPMQSMWHNWENEAWHVSEALPEMEEVWRSTLDEAIRQEWCYQQATHSGRNRTDELRMLGNGVNPDTAERAFIVLHRKLMSEL